MLTAARPHDGILAEEGSAREGSSGVRWIVDPLDGTMNYVYGYPAFCASVAAEIDGEAVVGVVYESLTGIVFWAVRGGGAWQDDKRLAVRSQTILAQALVGTGFSYEAKQRAQQGAAVAHLLARVADIRRGGSAALDLCRLAAGQLDAYYELDLSPWDYAAGRLIAEEAGAQVAALPAGHGKGPAIVGAGPALMPAFVDLLRKAGALRLETAPRSRRRSAPLAAAGERDLRGTAPGRDSADPPPPYQPTPPRAAARHRSGTDSF